MFKLKIYVNLTHLLCIAVSVLSVTTRYVVTVNAKPTTSLKFAILSRRDDNKYTTTEVGLRL